jgi:hypothetical protein
MKTDAAENAAVVTAFTQAGADLPTAAVSETVATVFQIDSSLNAAVTELTTMIATLRSALSVDTGRIAAIHAAIMAQDDALACVYQ